MMKSTLENIAQFYKKIMTTARQAALPIIATGFAFLPLYSCGKTEASENHPFVSGYIKSPQDLHCANIRNYQDDSQKKATINESEEMKKILNQDNKITQQNNQNTQQTSQQNTNQNTGDQNNTTQNNTTQQNTQQQNSQTQQSDLNVMRRFTPPSQSALKELVQASGYSDDDQSQRELNAKLIYDFNSLFGTDFYLGFGDLHQKVTDGKINGSTVDYVFGLHKYADVGHNTQLFCELDVGHQNTKYNFKPDTFAKFNLTQASTLLGAKFGITDNVSSIEQNTVGLGARNNYALLTFNKATGDTNGFADGSYRGLTATIDGRLILDKSGNDKCTFLNFSGSRSQTNYADFLKQSTTAAQLGIGYYGDKWLTEVDFIMQRDRTRFGSQSSDTGFGGQIKIGRELYRDSNWKIDGSLRVGNVLDDTYGLIEFTLYHK